MLNTELLLVPQVCKTLIHFSSSIHRIRLGEEIKRDYDKSATAELQELNTLARKTAAFSEQIHAVILVLKANDPRLEIGTYQGTLQRVRDHFRTHGNKVNNDINQCH